MNEKEIIEIYEEMKEHFGKDLANFEVHPKIFAYQVKIYRYYKERRHENSSVQRPAS